MKRLKLTLAILSIIIAFAFSTQNCLAKTITKEIIVQTKDSRVIKASLSYVKINGVKKYPTVLLLHSLGASSGEWGKLIPFLNNAGYAVIAMDLRGHGKSIYTADFKQRSWPYFTTKSYEKYPSDALALLNQAAKTSKLVSLDNLAIVGADIGANTAIIIAKELPKKPKALVLISPSVSFKGLYTPIALVEMGHVPILSMVSQKDRYSLEEQMKLSKYAQGGFYAQNYPNGGMGMLMLKVNPAMAEDITRWLIKYLK